MIVLKLLSELSFLALIIMIVVGGIGVIRNVFLGKKP